ncbi:unknown similar to AMEV010 [Choristoneura biennis entomopoxvirus]|uniref:Uncharacterized protein n=1 Tax=Choristoneura biennis entomopoxvirus TaxID=10288 RepID=A0A916KPJ8_CBEPV|nr:unknown similar to AMEV010 [Choristoneura biennis entomopoxvirus]CCU55627.1 unknown similar to AMEV010 [Choristoneura biennis entomopoxvirus]
MCLTDSDIILKNTKIIDTKINSNKRKFIYITKPCSDYINTNDNIFMFPFYGKINNINIINNDDSNEINNTLLNIDNKFNKKINKYVSYFDINIFQNYNNGIKILYYKNDYFYKEYKNILLKNNICSEYITHINNKCIPLLINKYNKINEFYIILCIIENNNKQNILNNNICLHIDYELISKYIIIPTINNYNDNNIYNYDCKCYIDNINKYDQNNIISNIINEDYKFIDSNLILFKKLNNIYYIVNGLIYNKNEKILYIKLNFNSKINNNIIMEIDY